jgi:outer membrane protein OmpA-like peptidoglycan-associated protein
MTGKTYTYPMLVLFAVLCSCKSPSTTTSASLPPDQAKSGTEQIPPKTRSITVGDPQNNSAVALIIGSDVGGEEGMYIAKQMDIQATDFGATGFKGVKILRVGEGIKVTFDGNVMFRKNSSTLSAESQKSLDHLAETLTKYDNTRIIIEGHTDGTGSAMHNQILSEKRAAAVAAHLSMRKVLPQRIKIAGYGESQPLFANTTEEGRKQNRRVEVVILADDKLREEAKGKAGE